MWWKVVKLVLNRLTLFAPPTYCANIFVTDPKAPDTQTFVFTQDFVISGFAFSLWLGKGLKGIFLSIYWISSFSIRNRTPARSDMTIITDVTWRAGGGGFVRRLISLLVSVQQNVLLNYCSRSIFMRIKLKRSHTFAVIC